MSTLQMLTAAIGGLIHSEQFGCLIGYADHNECKHMQCLMEFLLAKAEQLEHFLDQLLETVLAAGRAASISTEAIAAVLPVGGSSRLPLARLIVLLRDPLQRALSWLMHLRRFEGLQGDPAEHLAAELEALEALGEGALESTGFIWPNALLGSCYNAPLRRWQAAYGPGQLLVLASEQLLARPQASLEQVARFLQVEPRWDWGELLPYNVNPLPQPALPEALLERLQSFLQRQSGWALGQVQPPG
jgi:hypothetical protein